jgi:hypothetical protein
LYPTPELPSQIIVPTPQPTSLSAFAALIGVSISSAVKINALIIIVISRPPEICERRSMRRN